MQDDSRISEKATMQQLQQDIDTVCPTPLRAAGGLLRELSPGPLAPEARIMPLDQAAFSAKLTIY